MGCGVSVPKVALDENGFEDGSPTWQNIDAGNTTDDDRETAAAATGGGGGGDAAAGGAAGGGGRERSDAGTQRAMVERRRSSEGSDEMDAVMEEIRQTLKRSQEMEARGGRDDNDNSDNDEGNGDDGGGGGDGNGGNDKDGNNENYSSRRKNGGVIQMHEGVVVGVRLPGETVERDGDRAGDGRMGDASGNGGGAAWQRLRDEGLEAAEPGSAALTPGEGSDDENAFPPNPALEDNGRVGGVGGAVVGNGAAGSEQQRISRESSGSRDDTAGPREGTGVREGEVGAEAAESSSAAIAASRAQQNPGSGSGPGGGNSWRSLNPGGYLAELALELQQHKAVAPQEFSFEELRDATQCFKEELVLGEGGFGKVYEGLLLVRDEDTGQHVETRVAVKQLSQQGLQGFKEWLTEVIFLRRLQHPHLVQLVGYCAEKEKGLLVYEYMPNCSLDCHLFNEAEPPLTWEVRVKVALGAAKGLAYLHEGTEHQVIFRDLKAGNILLDEVRFSVLRCGVVRCNAGWVSLSVVC
ncbi:unnamed protein product [Closterium sp. Naga37s-1]|nr:unnamed protein product [Closterium sp. Naga37s-1]